MNKAIFIDKDGTLIPDIPYNVNPDLITLSPGAGSALRRLKDAGYLLVVVSNQSGVARGLFAETALQGVKQRLLDLLAACGVTLDGFYYCPHLPDAAIRTYAKDCDCRKPKAGMLTSAARELEIDLTRSWMVGDILADSEAGKRAGCHTVLIEKPDDPQRNFTQSNAPDFIVAHWQTAGHIILSEDRRMYRSYINPALRESAGKTP
jgi:D-glycero-D-manno-heptose 1,7-bisphosphate phosphatase